MSDTAIRIYILFLSINAVLFLGGFSISNPVSDLINAKYTQGDATDSTGWTSFMKMTSSLIQFFTGAGIVGLLTSAGMPAEIQLIIGAPFLALGVLALAPLITAGAGAVTNLIRWWV
jgi:hypothetical protein